MITVRLYGQLAKHFGKCFKFAARTPSEALRAMQVNFPSFAKKLEEHGVDGYHIVCDKEDRDINGLSWPVQREVRVVPVVAGASAGARIVIGAALILAGVFLLPTGGWSMAAISSGVGMVMGGVSEILFPLPEQEQYEDAGVKPGFAFDGPVNTVAQGNPVPICYGRMIVGSQVVSASMEAGDIPLW